MRSVSPAVLILAGTRPGGDPFAEEAGVAHKALIELESSTLLERVIAAVKGAGLSRVFVSCDEGPVADVARAAGAKILPAHQGPSASVAAAFEQLGAPMLVTTSDHALLQSKWVVDFIEDIPSDADVAIMLAHRSLIEDAIPGAKRTYLRFADGDWSGCNLFLLATPEASHAIATWSMVEAYRKTPWKIAARLGVGTLISMALRRLTMAQGIERLGRKIGIEARLVPARDGLAAFDVDKMADLAAIRELVQRQSG